MRQIKFRAWNGKEMFSCNQIQSILFEYEYPIISLTSRSGIHNSQDWETRQVTLMQFSNQEDVNGADIFEGDILSKLWKVVVFVSDEGTYMVEFKENPKRNKPMSLKKYLIHRYLAGTSDRDCEVIGNIYENKELLNPNQC